MANSKKPPASSTVSHAVSVRPQIVLQLHTFLKNHLKPKQRLLLALSGGLDSTVLLHLLVEAKRTIPFELHAMHVHHGLSKNANSWTDFCVRQCQQLQVPLQVVHVNVQSDSGLGIEGAARQLRYEALFGYKLSETSPDFIVTAHHQDDQAETLLLQMFRGAGVKGLASMAAVDKARRLLRPLLDVSRKELESYAAQHAIDWCEDESNDDTHYERNFVRHEVMPILESRYPAVKSVIARTASHLSEANELLDTLAAMDIEPLLQGNSLCLQGLAKLDVSRAKNGLRWWFARNQLVMPNAELLNEMYSQLMNAKPDANLSIQVQSNNETQNLSIKRYQQRAYLCRNQSVQIFDMVWNGEPELVLPNGGKLLFRQVTGAGLAIKLGMTRLRITNRDGGERFKPNALRPTRTLKHLLQEANIPPWQREQLPLIYWQDTLACVPGVGVAHELQAAVHELGIEIIWQEASI
ncbi:MAG TPA: tRNA lysidine(34) synthetase TilS [Methylotenera sp.]|nr:tRNA lysidine(34) synthetase TilS [Methylotenera sp.]